MAKCGYCNQEMLTSDGCTVKTISYKDGVYPRIKVGSAGDMAENSIIDPSTYRCGDCGAKWNHYHHYGCDMETCPKCGGQILSCDCE